MKRAIVSFLALAAAALADMPAGSWSTAESWGITAEGSTVSSSSGAGWSCPTTVYTFINPISLKTDEILTLSYDVANSGENVLTAVSFLATVDGVKKGISVSRSDYNSAGISLGVGAANEGYKNGYADVFAFQQTNAQDRVQVLTPSYTLSGVGNGTVTACIGWNSELEAFTLTVGASTTEETLSCVLGKSVALENLGVGLDGAAHSITNLSVSIIPEPTTATLSLLALAGLAARRRRK